ncbi:MAG: DUF2723 domain-containing protein [Candidatus Levybacteria bacterium]|nr:DUF2723 domain-containing protein [Candidatus Levybacteria bacterium]
MPKKDIFIAVEIAFVCLAAYLSNIAPTVTGGDVGDFLTAIYNKSIPHPPGFPVFTLFGILFSYLPLPFSYAWKVGFLSSVSMALVVVFVYLLVKRLLHNTIMSVVAAFTLAFVYPFWLYAEVAEVFAFTVLFEMLLLYLGVLYFQEKKTKVLYALSFVLGLSLSAHQVLILFFPSVILFIFAVNKEIVPRFFSAISSMSFPRQKAPTRRKRESRSSIKSRMTKKPLQATLLICISLFFLGLLPYTYIPVASSFDSIHKWGEIVSVHDAVRFLLRLDYGWIAQPGTVVGSSFLTLTSYVNYWLRELSLLFLVVSIVGVVISFVKKRVEYIGLFISFILAGPFFAVYASLTPHSGELLGAMERFYLLSGVFLVLFAALGVYECIQWIATVFSKKGRHLLSKSTLSTCLIVIFGIVPILFFLHNNKRTDLHKVFIGEYLASDALAFLPKRSYLLSFADTATLNTYYVQQVVGFRKDIALLSRLPLSIIINNTSALKKKRDQLLRRFPKLAREDANTLAFLHSASSQPIFSYSKKFDGRTLYGEFIWIPWGLVYKLATPEDARMSRESYVQMQRQIWINAHLDDVAKMYGKPNLTLTQSEIPKIYARQLIFTAQYISHHYASAHDAVDFYKKAIRVYPTTVEPYEELGYYYASIKQCGRARSYYSVATRLDPSSFPRYQNTLSKYCK